MDKSRKYLFKDLNETAKKVAVYNYINDNGNDKAICDLSEAYEMCLDVDEDTQAGLADVYYQENGEDYEN